LKFLGALTATDAHVPPPRPLVTQDDLEDDAPATIQRIFRSSLDRRR
jgi:hypothetical protein